MDRPALFDNFLRSVSIMCQKQACGNGAVLASIKTVKKTKQNMMMMLMMIMIRVEEGNSWIRPCALHSPLNTGIGIYLHACLLIHSLCTFSSFYTLEFKKYWSRRNIVFGFIAWFQGLNENFFIYHPRWIWYRIPWPLLGYHCIFISFIIQSWNFRPCISWFLYHDKQYTCPTTVRSGKR